MRSASRRTKSCKDSMPPDFSVVSMLARASSNREPVTCTAGPICSLPQVGQCTPLDAEDAMGKRGPGRTGSLVNRRSDQTPRTIHDAGAVRHDFR